LCKRALSANGANVILLREEHFAAAIHGAIDSYEAVESISFSRISSSL